MFAGYAGPLEAVHMEPREERTELRVDERTEKPVEARRDSETSTAVTPAASTVATSTTAVEERRARVRAKVNYSACVQSAAFGKDVVSCINMSRGGLGFRTKNAYPISTEVTVAVPFSQESPNAPAIYVPARVANISELPELQMFRRGVAFLPIAGTRTHT
jgi:hypothetical protein